jgi:DNA-binding transcriptional ArsR family regulator
MTRGAIRGKTLFAAVIFLASVLILAFKLLNPTPVQILVEGNTAIMTQVPGLFTYTDVLEIGLALVLMSATAAYILLHDYVATQAPTPIASVTDVILEERRQRWEEVAKTLKDDEQTLYKAIIDEGVINQSVLVEKTGLPKSNVSRALYGLESRGLIERRRRGMGNVVLLK